MFLASALLSDNTVTAVALTQWLVRCGVIPAALAYSWFSSYWRVWIHRLVNYNITRFYSQFPRSLEQAVQFGIEMLNEILNCFYWEATGIDYFKHLSIGFVC